MEPTALSLLPPLAAFILALLTKRVLLSLVAATLVAQLIIAEGNGLLFLESSVHLLGDFFSQAWVIYTLLFVLCIGSLIRLLDASHAVVAFIESVSVKRHWVTSKRSALMVAFGVGILLFIESTIATLIVATVSKPFARKYGISKEKIAYLCDTTAAPVCSLLAFNGWGALILGLLTTAVAAHQLVETTPMALLLEAIFYNFYAWVSLVMLFVVLYKELDLKAMKTIHTPYDHYQPPQHAKARFRDFILPLVALMAFLMGALWVSGNGAILEGNASQSLLISVLLTLVLMYGLYVVWGSMSMRVYAKEAAKGVVDLIPLTLVLMAAIIFSMSLKTLGTATFLGALVSDAIPLFLIPATIFIIASIIGFATGTSWGTFAIMIPIAVACVDPAQMSVGLVVGAVISGGVFGDHASPISDTTILAAMATECDIVNHVKTQLPYTLFSALFAALLFVAAGLVLTH